MKKITLLFSMTLAVVGLVACGGKGDLNADDNARPFGQPRNGFATKGAAFDEKSLKTNKAKLMNCSDKSDSEKLKKDKFTVQGNILTRNKASANLPVLVQEENHSYKTDNSGASSEIGYTLLRSTVGNKTALTKGVHSYVQTCGDTCDPKDRVFGVNGPLYGLKVKDKVQELMYSQRTDVVYASHDCNWRDRSEKVEPTVTYQEGEYNLGTMTVPSLMVKTETTYELNCDGNYIGDVKTVHTEILAKNSLYVNNLPGLDSSSVGCSRTKLLESTVSNYGGINLQANSTELTYYQIQGEFEEDED